MGNAEKLGLFSDFAPSVVYSVNKHNNFNLPFREKYMEEYAYSKLCHLYCTLDKSIMFEFHNQDMALSKVLNLKSIATILGHPELIIPEQNLDEENVVETMFEVKKNSAKLLKYVKIEADNFIRKTGEKNNLNYVQYLKENFGKNLVGILLYGSSATGEGNDYDNLVVLRNIPNNLYEKIQGIKLEEKGKEVGLIFIPEYAISKFLYINVSNLLFREKAKVLYGEINFPVESDRYTIFKEMYHAGFGSSKLISALNLIYKEPETFYDKPGLFEYFMKLNRFTLHGLMQADGYRILNKSHLLNILETEYNFKIPGFKPDADYLKKSFLEANRCSVNLAKELYRPDLAKEPNEALLKIRKRLRDRIYLSDYRNKPVYLFKSIELPNKGDVVPARMLGKDEEGYDTRHMALKHLNLELPRDFYIAKRL